MNCWAPKNVKKLQFEAELQRKITAFYSCVISSPLAARPLWEKEARVVFGSAIHMQIILLS